MIPLTVTHLVKKFAVSHGTRKFTVTFTATHICSLTWTRWIKSTSCHIFHIYSLKWSSVYSQIFQHVRHIYIIGTQLFSFHLLIGFLSPSVLSCFIFCLVSFYLLFGRPTTVPSCIAVVQEWCTYRDAKGEVSLKDKYGKWNRCISYIVKHSDGDYVVWIQLAQNRN